MKKIFTLLTLIIAVVTLNAQSGQTNKTMQYGGVERQYIEYIPANVQSPAPVLFVLHGLGDDMSNMFNSTGFKQIADQHGWIVITPQALEASVMGYSMGTAWNSGIHASLYGMDINVNEDVDDSGFIMAILDDLLANSNADASRVYVTGFSMGGFMSNRLAIEHGDRITAIASVSGTVGNVVQGNTPVGHVSAMHIHGTADGTVGYANADFNLSVASVSVGLGAEATVEYWRSYNQCSATPTTYNYPDNMNDNLTFERYEYTGGTEGTRTVFIKVNGGDHTWYYTPNNDIDYTTEIYNFFAGNPVSVSENELTANIFPNPAQDILHIEAENFSEVSLFNSVGQEVLVSNSSDLNVSQLPAGFYTARILFSNGQSLNSKVIIRR